MKEDILAKIEQGRYNVRISLKGRRQLCHRNRETEEMEGKGGDEEIEGGTDRLRQL